MTENITTVGTPDLPQIGLLSHEEKDIETRLLKLQSTAELRSSQNPEFAAASESVTTQMESMEAIKRQAFQTLADAYPEAMGEPLARIDAAATLFSQIEQLDPTTMSIDQLQTVLNQLDPHVVTALQKRRERARPGQQPTQLADDLRIAFDNNDARRLHTIAKAALGEVRKSDTAWEIFTIQEVLPEEVVADLQLFSDYIYLFNATKAVEATQLSEDDKKSLRAKLCSPFIRPSSGINLVFLNDVIEGNTELDEEFIKNIEQAVGELTAKVIEERPRRPEEKPRKPISRMQKVAIISGITGAALAATWSPKDAPRPRSHQRPPIQEQRTNPAQTESLHPQNDGFEHLKKASEQVVWEVEGKDLAGKYRTGTFSTFNSQTLSWTRDTTILPRPFTNDYVGQSDVVETRTFELSEGSKSFSLKLPTKQYMELNTSDIKIEGFDSDNISISRHDNGVFEIYVSGQKTSDNIVVHAGFVGQPLSESAYGPSEEDMSSPFMSPSYYENLPDDISDKMTQLYEDQSLSDFDRAILITNWIRGNFTYSADTKYSDYANQASDSSDFYSRIAKSKHGECDPINSLAVMMLRTMNIPARVVVGFSNHSPTDTQFTALEQHMWVEAWVDEQWVEFDATPDKMDRKTKDAYDKAGIKGSPNSDGLGGGDGEGEGQGNQSEGGSDGKSGIEELKYFLSEMGDELSLEKLKLQSLFAEHPAPLTLVPIVTLAGAYVTSGIRLGRRQRRLGKRNKDLAERMGDSLLPATNFTRVVHDHDLKMTADSIAGINYEGSQRDRKEGLKQILTDPINPSRRRWVARAEAKVESAHDRLGLPIENGEDLLPAVAEAMGLSEGAYQKSWEIDQAKARRNLRSIAKRDLNAAVKSMHKVSDVGGVLYFTDTNVPFDKYYATIIRRTKGSILEALKEDTKKGDRKKLSSSFDDTGLTHAIEEKARRALFVFWRESQK